MLKSLDKITILFLFIFVSCTSIENNCDETKRIDNVDLNNIANEKFGKNYSLDFNSSKEFVICQNRDKSKVAGNSPIEYFIYDVSKNKMIEENNIPLGNISWISDYEVRVAIHPGMIQKNVKPDNGYILNVKTNLKTKINGGVH